MAKIVILMAKGDSGKTRTINKVGEKLGLTKYATRNKEGYPSFVTWAGEAKEIFMQTSSLQEFAAGSIKKVFAQTSSIQERNQAILEKVLEEAQGWIDFLSDKPEAIAIIPFTLRGKEAMRDLILQPLNLFRESGNEVKLVYLKNENFKQKKIRILAASVVSEAKPDFEIESRKDEEDRQSDELLAYLSLKSITPLVTPSLLEF